jgi:hypothetical protein
VCESGSGRAEEYYGGQMAMDNGEMMTVLDDEMMMEREGKRKREIGRWSVLVGDRKPGVGSVEGGSLKRGK